MVVNHSPAVAFAAANVGFPKICVSPLFRNQNVYMLHACLATLIRICLILYQYRSRRSLRLLLSKIIANSGMIRLLHFGAMGIAPQYIRCTPSAIGVPASSISSPSAGVGTPAIAAHRLGAAHQYHPGTPAALAHSRSSDPPASG